MPKLVPGYRDEVKEKILEAAWEVIRERGTKDTTMDDFARAMNCSKGALYNYFRNKDQLLEEAISTGHMLFQEELFSRFRDGDFFTNAEEYFDNEVMNSYSHIQTTLDLLMEGARNEKLAEALKLKYDGAIGSLSELFRELGEKGAISMTSTPREVAESVYALRTGVVMNMAAGLPVDKARDMWMRGLRGMISPGAVKRPR